MKRLQNGQLRRSSRGHRVAASASKATPTASHHRDSTHPRAGVSLIEVVISVAIFLASLTAIMSLLDTGSQARLSVQLDAEAALRAESLMGEYLSGMRDMVATSEQPFENDADSGWTFTTTVEPSDGESLLKLTVVVVHTANGSEVNSSFRLMRLCRDPQLFLDAAMAASEGAE